MASQTAPPTPRLSRPSAPTRARLLILAGIVLSAFSLRTAVTSLTPLLTQVGDDLGFGSAVVGVFGMVPPAMFAAFGLATPLVVRRFGLEHTALAAMVLATVGLAGRSLVQGTAGLLLLSAVALAGMGIGNVVIPPLVKRFFPERVATLSTVYITVLQLGTMVPPLLAVPVADAHGWRTSLAMWSVFSLIAVIPWVAVLLVRTAPDPHDLDAAAPVAPPVQVWRSPVAWGLATMFSMTSLNTYAMFTWLPPVLTSAGHSESFGGTMVALFSGIGLISALVAPQLAGRMRNPFPVVVASVTCFVLGYAGLLLSPESGAVLWVTLVGFGPTTFPLALTLINLRSRTQSGSAALSGFAQGVGYTVASLGPVVFGLLHEGLGGWTPSFAFLGATLVLLVAGGWVVCKPHMLED